MDSCSAMDKNFNWQHVCTVPLWWWLDVLVTRYLFPFTKRLVYSDGRHRRGLMVHLNLVNTQMDRLLILKEAKYFLVHFCLQGASTVFSTMLFIAQRLSDRTSITCLDENSPDEFHQKTQMQRGYLVPDGIIPVENANWWSASKWIYCKFSNYGYILLV